MSNFRSRRCEVASRHVMLIVLAVALATSSVSAASAPAADSAQASSKIAFRGSDLPTGQPDAIFVMNADGSRLTNVTRSAADAQRFAWSPRQTEGL
jgi:hypothetical protein